MALASNALSIEELEHNWRRIESLVSLRDWINGATLLALALLFRWGYRDLAWASWTLLVWTIGLILAASLIMRVVGVDRSGNSVGFWLGLPAAAFGVWVGTAILGGLLSFFAENEPKALLGRNGFINADAAAVLGHTSRRYAPILVLALNEVVLAVRVALLTRVPAHARLGGHVGRMIGAVIVSAVVGVALAGLFSPAVAEVGLGVFYAGWFAFPWRKLSRDSVQDQIAEGRPALYAGRALPLEFTERAAPAMVVIALVLALMFGAVGATLLALSARQIGAEGMTLTSAVLLPISLAVLGVFCILALLAYTLLFGARRVSVGHSQVTVHERAWAAPDETSWRSRLAATFDRRTQRTDLREYNHLGRRVERHTSSDGPDYDEHVLLLAHRTDRKKDIVIYRAFHDQNLDAISGHYARLLRLPQRDMLREGSEQGIISPPREPAFRRERS